LTHVLRLQGAKLPFRANFSWRLRIQQRGVERHGPVIGYGVQRQFVNFELEGFSSGLAGSKLHDGTVRDDLVDNQRGLLRAAGWCCVPDTFTAG
jgi:hypothetical protein